MAFYKLLCLQFCISSDQWKNTMEQRFYKEFERHFCMKIIVTIIPANLATNYPLSIYKNQKQEPKIQQVGGLVMRNISSFCLWWVVLYFKGMMISIEFYKRIFLNVIPARIVVPWNNWKSLREYCWIFVDNFIWKTVPILADQNVLIP